MTTTERRTAYPNPSPELAYVISQWSPWLDRNDGEHAAAYTLLIGAPEICNDPKFTKHVDRDAIDWDAIMAEAWEPHELILIKTACSCLSATHRTGREGTEIHPGQAANLLPDDAYALWLAIINAVRTGEVPDLPLDY